MLTELQNALRSGDTWGQGSRQFKEYLLPLNHFAAQHYNLAELVNAQLRQPFAAYWGGGTTSSYDGQNFKAGGHGRSGGQVNLKYGQEPGVQFYTHISDQYAPFHTKFINAAVRDATHALDGLLYHESDLRIEERYTDTAGFTESVCTGMRFCGWQP
jgi:TnpA family transposase